MQNKKNLGFHRILTSKAHRKREKISRNKTKRIHCVEFYSDGNNRTARNQIFLSFKPKPKIYFLNQIKSDGKTLRRNGMSTESNFSEV
jgi:hypothetical protein